MSMSSGLPGLCRGAERGFCGYGFALWRNYPTPRKTFRFSLIHLSVLFAALLVDHYVILNMTNVMLLKNL